MKRLAALLLSFACCGPVAAQDINGSARASDGDTLNITGIVIRLHGIDAPELQQSCTRDGQPWACGKEAASKLASLVAGKSISCEQRDTDDYGRIVAICMAGQVNLSAAMADAGLAVALPHFTTDYVAIEARAREQRRGIWGTEFQMPGEYRAAHPRMVRDRVQPVLSAPGRAAAPAPSTTYFRNCREAWAAGAAPLRRGEPGYRAEMDGDGDGIACEPYRGR